MGLDPSILHAENIARLLTPEQRKAERVMTVSEAREKAAVRDEKELQGQIANYLRLHGIWFDQDATHKRRTGSLGTPDFIFPYNGRFIAWEVKTPWAAKLRPEQEDAREAIIAQGGQWRLVTSLSHAIQHLAESK